MKVKECMCKKVACVTSQDTISNVAKVMESNHIGCVPVCDNTKSICGIITDRDIVLRAVACDKDIKNTMASEIMTTSVCTCTEDEDMTNAQSKMASNQIRRLPVCDTNNRVIGMLTFGDLANNTTEIGENQVSTAIEDICNCNGQMKNAQ